MEVWLLYLRSVCCAANVGAPGSVCGLRGGKGGSPRRIARSEPSVPPPCLAPTRHTEKKAGVHTHGAARKEGAPRQKRKQV